MQKVHGKYRLCVRNRTEEKKKGEQVYKASCIPNIELRVIFHGNNIPQKTRELRRCAEKQTEVINKFV